MPRGLTKRRPATVTALLDAALELFADQGFGATSIQQICSRAGLTKGAFYSNFESKESLFLALLDRSWERRATWIRGAIPSGHSGEGHPAETTIARDHVVDRQWTLVSTEFSLHAIRRPAVAAQLVAHEMRARSELALLVSEALAHIGRVAVIPEIDLARMIVAVSEGSDIQELTDESAGDTSHAGLGSVAIDALLRYYSAPVDTHEPPAPHSS